MALARVINALDRLAPPKFAAAWDNVGLLVDALAKPESTEMFVVLFTNDLTPAVLDEAVARNSNLIVTYHPTPFASQKKFITSNVPARIILTCARHNIAVYSPHTAWDVAPGGLNEWLINGIADSLPRAQDFVVLRNMQPVKKTDDAAAAAAGYGDGRIGDLPETASVADVVTAVKHHLHLGHVQLSLPSALQIDVAEARRAEGEAGVMRIASTIPARTIAVCAGSGSGVLAGVRASVYVTGEMGHHETLAAAHAGTAVILTGHSNCERGYLPLFAEKLRTALNAESAAMPGQVFSPIQMVVSTVDCDPLFTV